ncbi:hypothetical protein H180DRAFT_04622 [Streptomyces sp. WMMB 322]|nr:hypothetical protein H180DRAFT_04622 [Streptomyces sp. WMMB 322]
MTSVSFRVLGPILSEGRLILADSERPRLTESSAPRLRPSSAEGPSGPAASLAGFVVVPNAWGIAVPAISRPDMQATVIMARLVTRFTWNLFARAGTEPVGGLERRTYYWVGPGRGFLCNTANGPSYVLCACRAHDGSGPPPRGTTAQGHRRACRRRGTRVRRECSVRMRCAQGGQARGGSLPPAARSPAFSAPVHVRRTGGEGGAYDISLSLRRMVSILFRRVLEVIRRPGCSAMGEVRSIARHSAGNRTGRCFDTALPRVIEGVNCAARKAR